MPVSINRKLDPDDRSGPDGAIISAFLFAAVDGDTIVGGGIIPRSLFGRCDPMVPSADWISSVYADEVDMEAKRSGAVGRTSVIAQRRGQEQNAGGLAVELREAAVERAAIQLLDNCKAILS
jgi:hypothetical protein